MNLLTSQEIKNFKKDGAIVLRNKFDVSWIEKLKKGVEIGFDGKKYLTKPGKAFLMDAPKFPLRSQKIRDERHGPTSWVVVIIKEGKFRQVRKMTAAVGFPTLRLIRVRIGDIHLNNLEVGKVIEVKNLVF